MKKAFDHIEVSLLDPILPWGRWFLWFFFLVMLGLVPLDGQSNVETIPFTGPILRVESGMHTSMIRRFALDVGERFIASVSDDKTLRIWNRESGVLLLTLRVPIGLTHEGGLFAVAVSPDGRTVAVGGQTCVEWDNTYCIYLIDVMSGKMRRRISQLPETVSHLAFSPNGAYLAAVFAEKAGLRVFGIPDGAVIFMSEPYNEPANWLDFAADGRLVTSSSDGLVRLYDANFQLQVVKPMAKLSKPYGVAFSPDGSKVAVGFRDRTTVAVLDGHNLSLRYLPDVMGVKNNLWVVAWSRDGKSLYAGGGHSEKGRYLIRWWSQAGEANEQGRGEYLDVGASHGYVMQIQTLKEGGLVFVGADPLVGVLDHQGFPVFLKQRTIVPFQGSANRLLVSEKGDVVEFGYDATGEKRGLFSVGNSQLSVNSFSTKGLQRARTKSEEINVTGWWGETLLQYNGQPIPLQAKEISHSLALDAKDRFFVLGTSLNLRLYSKISQLRWKTATPGPVWAVNVTEDGKQVVAALGDGTIRWYDALRGEEILALFVHNDQKRWVMWTPMKYYSASADGDSLLGWHINRDKNSLAEFYPVSQFPKFFRPEYFAQLFR